jgi:hypothetical protein
MLPLTGALKTPSAGIEKLIGDLLPPSASHLNEVIPYKQLFHLHSSD